MDANRVMFQQLANYYASRHMVTTLANQRIHAERTKFIQQTMNEAIPRAIASREAAESERQHYRGAIRYLVSQCLEKQRRERHLISQFAASVAARSFTR